MNGPFQFDLPWWVAAVATGLFNAGLLVAWTFLFRAFGWVWLSLRVVYVLLAGSVAWLQMPVRDAVLEASALLALSVFVVWLRLKRERRYRAGRP